MPRRPHAVGAPLDVASAKPRRTRREPVPLGPVLQIAVVGDLGDEHPFFGPRSPGPRLLIGAVLARPDERAPRGVAAPGAVPVAERVDALDRQPSARVALVGTVQDPAFGPTELLCLGLGE